jgi:hypothetical protein
MAFTVQFSIIQTPISKTASYDRNGINHCGTKNETRAHTAYCIPSYYCFLLSIDDPTAMAGFLKKNCPQ